MDSIVRQIGVSGLETTRGLENSSGIVNTHSELDDKGGILFKRMP